MWRKFSSLVVGEVGGTGRLATATMHAVTAAREFPGPIHVHVLGPKSAAEDAAAIDGVDEVIWQDAPNRLTAEVIAPHIQYAIKERSYAQIIAGSTFFSKDLMPRLAGLVGVQPISEVMVIENESTFVRPIYAGNAMQKVEVSQSPKIMTIRTTSFDKPGVGGAAAITPLEYELVKGVLEIVSEEIVTSDRPELAGARIVVSGGRGLQKPEHFHFIEELADVLGGAVGATRAIVDADYCSNDLQVGQTGKNVAPDLYIAVGISGAIQHLAGMKDSKVIVSINTDPDAPIFGITDYGLVGDCLKILPELTDKLKK